MSFTKPTVQPSTPQTLVGPRKRKKMKKTEMTTRKKEAMTTTKKMTMGKMTVMICNTLLKA